MVASVFLEKLSVIGEKTSEEKIKKILNFDKLPLLKQEQIVDFRVKKEEKVSVISVIFD